MTRLVLDLYCGAGGVTKGLQRAGFQVVGVDINPQKNYCGDWFVECDALDVLRGLLAGANVAAGWGLRDFVGIHASPPCQRDSQMSNCRPGLAETYPSLISPTRELLDRTGLPWMIENVPGAPLRADVTLCGQMFGLNLYRHRLFETNFPVAQPLHPKHVTPASRAGHWKPGTIMSVSGHVSPIAVAREAMGIDWMTREELAESIPPAYAEFMGRQLRAHLMTTPMRQEALAA